MRPFQGRRQLCRRGGGPRRPTTTRPTRTRTSSTAASGKRHHPRRRPQPDRPGASNSTTAACRPPRRWPAGLRRRDGQLQPGDGVDRRRLVRPPVLRAADGRGRARGDRARAAAGGGRPVRWPDPAAAGPAAGGGGRPLLGTPFEAIDIAEDRERFGGVLRQLGLEAPAWGIAGDVDDAVADRRRDRLPRAGAAELRARRPGDAHLLRRGLAAARPVEPGSLVDRFVEDAIEVDVDAVCDGTDLDRRGHAARRGGRRALRRLGLRDPDAVAGRASWRPDPRARPRDRARRSGSAG